jgi:hypothetical protein
MLYEITDSIKQKLHVTLSSGRSFHCPRGSGPLKAALAKDFPRQETDLIPCFRLAAVLHRLGQADDEGHFGEQREAALALAAKVHCAAAVPAAVGSGRSSLPRKVHALLHSARHTAPTWQSAVDFLNDTFTWTTDLGTESGVTRFVSTVPDFFGAWACDDTADDVAQDPLAPPVFAFMDPAEIGQMRPETPLKLDLRSGIVIPGILHICHNITEAMEDVLQHWTVFTKSIKHLSRFLARRWSRQRLVATCFSVMPFSAQAHHLDNFSSVVYEGRWGVIVDCLADLLPLRNILRGAWNYDAYKLGNAGDEPNGHVAGDFAVEMSVVDDAIKSTLFWGYATMIFRVAGVLGSLAGWSEGCPCHDGVERFRTKSAYKRAAVFREVLGLESCPLSTCRAPELAAGEVTFEIVVPCD